MSFKKSFFLTLILFSLTYTGYSQTSFRFIAKSDSHPQEHDTISGPIYEHALKIYNKLVSTIGNSRYTAPPFVITSSSNWGAFLESDGRSIGLEEKAYRVCMSMGTEEEPEKGENALAMLLGHELIHYYEKHKWRQGFIEKYDTEVADKLDDTFTMEELSNETQSDVLGGFLAFTAGFEVFEQLPEFYQKLYDSYGLPEEMPGYPSLTDRKKLAAQSVQKIKKMAEAFEMANVMTAIGRYSEARAFYKFILEDYQGREIFNNLGVLTILEAKTFCDKPEDKYQLPLELDMFFGKNGKGMDSIYLVLRENMIREAIGYFKSAVHLDAGYAPAYQNLAVGYFLLQDFDRARYFANVEARQHALADSLRFPKTAERADILLALIEDWKGNQDSALIMLSDLTKVSGSMLAQRNIDAIKGELKAPKTVNGPQNDEIEGISHREINTFATNRRTSFEKEKMFNSVQFRVWEDIEGLQHSKLYRFSSSAGVDLPTMYVHITKDSYTGKVDDFFAKGTKASEIKEEFGEPQSLIATTNGSLFVYEQMVILFNAKDELYQWAHYKTKLN